VAGTREPRGRRSRKVLFDEDGLQVRVDPDNPSGRFFVVHGLEASYIDLDDPEYLDFEYLQRIADTMDVMAPPPAPLDVVHLGGAGCALARSFAAVRPKSRQIVFEVDGKVLDTARRFLGLRTSSRLAVRVGDARAGVAGLPTASADLVVGDAFVGSDVPRPLATVEFAADVRRVLRDDGVYALNVIDRPPLNFTRTQVSTLASVFGTVVLAAETPVLRGRRYGNIVLFATDRSLPVEELAALAARAPVPEKLLGRSDAMAFSGGAKPLLDADLPAAAWKVGHLPVPEGPR